MYCKHSLSDFISRDNLSVLVLMQIIVLRGRRIEEGGWQTGIFHAW